MLIGYYGGWIDEIVSRALDSLLAIPALVLALVMLGTIGPSQAGIVIVIVVLYTPIVARVVRSATLNIRDLWLHRGGETARRIDALHHVPRDSAGRAARAGSRRRRCASRMPFS